MSAARSRRYTSGNLVEGAGELLDHIGHRRLDVEPIVTDQRDDLAMQGVIPDDQSLRGEYVRLVDADAIGDILLESEKVPLRGGERRLEARELTFDRGLVHAASQDDGALGAGQDVRLAPRHAGGAGPFSHELTVRHGPAMKYPTRRVRCDIHELVHETLVGCPFFRISKLCSSTSRSTRREARSLQPLDMRPPSG